MFQWIKTWWERKTTQWAEEETQRQAEAQREQEAQRLAAQQELKKKIDAMMAIDVAAIVAQTGVTEEKVEAELGYPTRWQQFFKLPGNLVQVLEFGRCCPTEGEQGLYQLYCQRVEELVAKMPAAELDGGVLSLYSRQSYRSRAFEQKALSGTKTLYGFFSLSMYLSREGKQACVEAIENIVVTRAARCSTPEEALRLWIEVPKEEHGKPICTCEAVRKATRRMYEIYEPLIAQAQDVKTVEDLEIPNPQSFNGLRWDARRRLEELKKAEIHALAKKQIG